MEEVVKERWREKCRNRGREREREGDGGGERQRERGEEGEACPSRRQTGSNAAAGRAGQREGAGSGSLCLPPLRDLGARTRPSHRDHGGNGASALRCVRRGGELPNVPDPSLAYTLSQRTRVINAPKQGKSRQSHSFSRPFVHPYPLSISKLIPTQVFIGFGQKGPC